MGAYITSIGTAVPSNRYPQENIANFMCENMPLSNQDQKKLKLLYRATGISYRHSVLDDFKREKGAFSFFENTINLEPAPSTSKRMALYRSEAIGLAKEAVNDALKDKHRMSTFTHIITVSCTGMYAPGLDVDLIKALNLKNDINRLSVNFMGCYAALNALGLARQICEGPGNIKILIVSVELCTLHLQQNSNSDNILAHSLFSDGAAATVVSNTSHMGDLEIVSNASYLSINGKKDMAWKIGDFGFEMSLSSYVPDIIKDGIKGLAERLVDGQETDLSQIDHYAIHPGGKKILEVIEQELELQKEVNEVPYQILRNYGNMSSATILFVLKQTIKRVKAGESVLSFAFGPGLTLESLFLKGV